jgi:hypothetical protein
VLAINNQPASPASTSRSFCAAIRRAAAVAHRRRGGESVRLTGRYAPTCRRRIRRDVSAAARIRPRRSGSDRKRVEAKSRGVAAFTLLLSPDQFDLNRAVTWW